MLVLMSTPGIFAMIGVAIVVIAILIFVTGYVKAAPDTAIIISGFGKRKI